MRSKRRRLDGSRQRTRARLPRTHRLHPAAPHKTIPNTYRRVPIDGLPDEGLAAGRASNAELRAAGFYSRTPPPRPGIQPVSEFLIELGPQLAPVESLIADMQVIGLRDGSGRIVATWDEGRWWTPAESDAFLEVLVAEIDEVNR